MKPEARHGLALFFCKEIVRSHHLIVLVLEQMAVPHIAARITFEAHDDARHHARIGAHRIFPAHLLWAWTAERERPVHQAAAGPSDCKSLGRWLRLAGQEGEYVHQIIGRGLTTQSVCIDIEVNWNGHRWTVYRITGICTSCPVCTGRQPRSLR